MSFFTKVLDLTNKFKLNVAHTFTALQTFSSGIDMNSSSIINVNDIRYDNSEVLTLNAFGEITSTQENVSIQVYDDENENLNYDYSAIGSTQVLRRKYRNRESIYDITVIDDASLTTEGHFHLAGDFTLTNTYDVLVVIINQSNDFWVEVSRSDNVI